MLARGLLLLLLLPAELRQRWKGTRALPRPRTELQQDAEVTLSLRNRRLVRFIIIMTATQVVGAESSGEGGVAAFVVEAAAVTALLRLPRLTMRQLRARQLRLQVSTRCPHADQGKAAP